MNNEVLAKGQIGFGVISADEWYYALDTLYRDWSLQVKLGRAGREVVKQSYSVATITDELANILRNAAGA
jgi:glycosyltransferase involved in cell wall biosynthesis